MFIKTSIILHLTTITTISSFAMLEAINRNLDLSTAMHDLVSLMYEMYIKEHTHTHYIYIASRRVPQNVCRSSLYKILQPIKIGRI